MIKVLKILGITMLYYWYWTAVSSLIVAGVLSFVSTIAFWNLFLIVITLVHTNVMAQQLFISSTKKTAELVEHFRSLE